MPFHTFLSTRILPFIALARKFSQRPGTQRRRPTASDSFDRSLPRPMPRESHSPSPTSCSERERLHFHVRSTGRCYGYRTTNFVWICKGFVAVAGCRKDKLTRRLPTS